MLVWVCTYSHTIINFFCIYQSDGQGTIYVLWDTELCVAFYGSLWSILFCVCALVVLHLIWFMRTSCWQWEFCFIIFKESSGRFKLLFLRKSYGCYFSPLLLSHQRVVTVKAIFIHHDYFYIKCKSSQSVL